MICLKVNSVNMQALGKRSSGLTFQIKNDARVQNNTDLFSLILGETPPREIICIYLRSFPPVS